MAAVSKLGWFRFFSVKILALKERHAIFLRLSKILELRPEMWFY